MLKRDGLSARAAALAGLLLGLALTAAPGAPLQKTAGVVDALMTRYHDLGEFNGSVLVARQGRVLFQNGYGFADFEKGVPNGPETRFLIGSISKQMTAVMVLSLVEAGRLSLDTTLAEALPYYRRDTGRKVTIRHLLDHTSGIPSFTGRIGVDIKLAATTEGFIRAYCSGDLAFEPGSRFAYNNGGYVILGAVIERLTGSSYEEAMRKAVFGPLGMTSSGLAGPDPDEPLRAKGYQRRGGRIVPAPSVDPRIALSAGGLYATVRDLALWEQVFTKDLVLPPKGRAALASAPANAYACGQIFARWPVGPGGAEREIVFHGGRIEGFNSLFLRIPEDRVLIVLLNNTDSTRLQSMSRGLLDILYGREPAAPRRALAEEFRMVLNAAGEDAALCHIRNVVRADPALYDPEPEEIQLNALGYECLEAKKGAAALAVLAFTAETFPRSWNAYDSLAEVQARMGKTEAALENYRKSLELNPGNANAAREIEKLKAKIRGGPRP